MSRYKVVIYTIFFLLFSIAKAFGFTNEDKTYLYIGLIGLIFAAISVLLSRYSKEEIVGIAVLMSISLAAMVSSGKQGSILPAIVIIASKDVDIDNIIKKLPVSWICAIILRILYALIIGDIYNYKHELRKFLGYKNRYSLGYSAPNLLHITLFIIISLLLYNKIVYKTWQLVVLGMINIVVFLFDYSFTGIIMIFLLLVLSKSMMAGSEDVTRAQVICCFIPLLCSFMPMLFDDNGIINYVIEKATTGRNVWNREVLRAYGIHLLGQKYDGRLSYEVVDNFYVFSIVRYGILWTILFLVCFAIVIYKYYKIKDTNRLLFILLFLVYGYTEAFVQNPFMNFTWLFIAEEFWIMMRKIHFGKEKKEEKFIDISSDNSTI